jgi:hypothetical protein
MTARDVMSRWLDIESAPEGGIACLLWPYYANYNTPPEVTLGFHDSEQDAWVSEHNPRSPFEPTHWQPLPEPPTTAAEAK